MHGYARLLAQSSNWEVFPTCGVLQLISMRMSLGVSSILCYGTAWVHVAVALEGGVLPAIFSFPSLL